MDFLIKSISNFQLPFNTDGQLVCTTPFGTIENGKRKSDGLPVTVFTYKTSEIPSSLLKNHIHRSKIFKIPGLVKVLDIIDSSTEKVYIITERVIPLMTTDYHSFSEDSIKLGLYQLASTLHILHDQAKSLFGAVCMGNVFVNEKGEWELYGLELSTNLDNLGTLSSNVQAYNSLVKGFAEWELSVQSLQYVDANLMSKLVEDLLGHKTPSSWKPLLTQLSKGASGVQKLCDKISSTPRNTLISIYNNLKEIHIKDLPNKIMIISAVQEEITQNVSIFNNTTPGFLENFILPEIVQCLELISSSNQPPSTQVPFLSCILLLACSEYSDVISDEVFNQRIKPVIFNAFTVADRQIRYLLLINFTKFISKLNQTEVTEKIFPNFIQGLSDTDQTIRLQTLKNVSNLVGKITERQLNNDLLRVLAKTQVDKDVEIRTLTILIITKIAHKLSKSSNRSTILATAFTKSLKDPQLKPRLATLYGLEITIDLFDADTISQKILTVIGPGLLDSNSQVRENAKRIFQLYWNKLEEESLSLIDSDSTERINTEDFEKMLDDNKDEKLADDFMRNVKLSTPTLQSVLGGSSENSPDIRISQNGEEDESGWGGLEAPIEASSNSFTKVVSVQRSWNNDFNDMPTSNASTITTKKKVMANQQTLKRPSILQRNGTNRASILSKPSHLAKHSKTISNQTSSKQKAQYGVHDVDDDDDGWGTEW